MRDFLAWCAEAGMPSIDAGPMSRMPHSADLLVYRWKRCVEIQRHGPEGATLCPSLHQVEASAGRSPTKSLERGLGEGYG